MKLKVTSFKSNGTLYIQEENEIYFNNYDDVYEFKNKIDNNDKSIHKFSGLAGGFINEFTYHIELIDKTFFLNYLLYSKENERKENE